MTSKSEFLQRRGYKVVERIAKGSFGKVFKAVHVPTDSLRAIKIINNQSQTDEMKKCTHREIEALKRSNHPNILKLHDNFITPNHTFIITALHDTDLKAYVEKNGIMTEAQSQIVISQVAQGIQFLWQQQIIHRDLKPANLLLSLQGGEIAQVVIADFGFARELAAKAMASTLVGTPLYVAPELLQHQPYGPEADLWSVGCILYEMISGTHPFSVVDGKQAINMLVLKSNIENYFRTRRAVTFPPVVTVSESCTQLMQGLLQIQPHLRRAFMADFVSTVEGWANATLPPTQPTVAPEEERKEKGKEQKGSEDGPHSQVQAQDTPHPNEAATLPSTDSNTHGSDSKPGAATDPATSTTATAEGAGAAHPLSMSKLPDDQLSAAQLRSRLQEREQKEESEADAGNSKGGGGGVRGRHRKILLHLRADGGAPILRVSRQACAGHLQVRAVKQFLRKQLRLGQNQPLFLYCHLPFSGNAFAPGPEERVLTLYEGFGMRRQSGQQQRTKGDPQQQEEVVVHYSIHDAPQGWCKKCNWRDCCCPNTTKRPDGAGSTGADGNSNLAASVCENEAVERMRRSRFAFGRPGGGGGGGSSGGDGGGGSASTGTAVDESYILMGDPALIPVSMHSPTVVASPIRSRFGRAHPSPRFGAGGDGVVGRAPPPTIPISSSAGVRMHPSQPQTPLRAPPTTTTVAAPHMTPPPAYVEVAAGSHGSGAGGAAAHDGAGVPSTIPATMPVSVGGSSYQMHAHAQAQAQAQQGQPPYSPHTPPLRSLPAATGAGGDDADNELDGFVLVDSEYDNMTTGSNEYEPYEGLRAQGDDTVTAARALLGRVLGW